MSRTAGLTLFDQMLRRLELMVPPPAVAILIGTAMWFAADLGPSLELPAPARIVVSSFIASAGGLIALAGDLQFKRNRTTVNPFRPQNTSALVTSGIYRFTRNPMYLGMLLVLVGWSVFVGAAIAFLGPAAFVAYITRFQIAPEERVLGEKFGESYSSYMARVRRWV